MTSTSSPLHGDVGAPGSRSKQAEKEFGLTNKSCFLFPADCNYLHVAEGLSFEPPACCVCLVQPLFYCLWRELAISVIQLGKKFEFYCNVSLSSGITALANRPYSNHFSQLSFSSAETVPPGALGRCCCCGESLRYEWVSHKASFKEDVQKLLQHQEIRCGRDVKGLLLLLFVFLQLYYPLWRFGVSASP